MLRQDTMLKNALNQSALLNDTLKTKILKIMKAANWIAMGIFLILSNVVKRACY